MMNKKYKISYLMIIAIVVIAMASCYNNISGSVFGKETKTITDIRGVQVNVSKNPKTIICLNETIDQILYAVDKDKQKVVQPFFINKIELLPQSEQDRLKGMPSINPHYKPMSTETIVSVHPDIIADLTKDPKIDSRSEELGGVPVVGFSKDSLQEIAESFKIMGAITGNEERGLRISYFITNTIKSLNDKTCSISDKRKVYYANGNNYETPGPKTIMNNSLTISGGLTYWDTNNIASNSNPTSEGIAVPIESIIEFNPYVIFTKNASIRENIMNDNRLSNVDAVKNNRVYNTLVYMRIDSIHSVPGTIWLVNHIYPSIDTEDCYSFASKYYELLYGIKINSSSEILRKEN